MMNPSVSGIVGCLLGMLFCTASFATELEDLRTLMRKGQFSEAVEGLNGFLANSPGDLQGRFLLGVALAETNRSQEAIAVFTELTEDYPSLPEPHNNLAVLHAAAGNYSKARDALLIAINTHPSYATGHENLGDIYAKMAGVAYDKALQLDNHSATARAKLALVDELFSARAADVDVAPLVSAPPTVAAVDTTQTTQPTQTTQSAQATTTDASSDNTVDRRQVLSALAGWAAAWSSQDVDRYLSHYAADFLPSNGLERDVWRVSRRKRLTKPSFIDVQLSNARVEFYDVASARVTFTQKYRSDRYQDVVRKEILMSNDGEQWRIISEAGL